MDARAWRTQILDEYEKNNIPPFEELALINDYLIEHNYKNYTNLTYAQVMNLAEAWYKTTKKETNPGLAWRTYSFKDGHSIQRLLSWQSKRFEGSQLRHCAFTHHKNSLNLYSLRTPGNLPLVTISIRGGVVNQVKSFRNSKPSHVQIYQYLLPFIKEKKLKIDSGVVSFLGGAIVTIKELKKSKINYLNNIYSLENNYKKGASAPSVAFFSSEEITIAESSRIDISLNLVNFVDEDQQMYFLKHGNTTARVRAIKCLVERYQYSKRELTTEMVAILVMEGMEKLKGFSFPQLVVEESRTDVYKELLRRGRLDCPTYTLFEGVFSRMWYSTAREDVLKFIFNKLPPGAGSVIFNFVKAHIKRALNVSPLFFSFLIKNPEALGALSFMKNEFCLSGPNVEENLALLLTHHPEFFSKKDLYQLLSKETLSSSTKTLLEDCLRKQL